MITLSNSTRTRGERSTVRSTVALPIDFKDYGLDFWVVVLTNQSGVGSSAAGGSPTDGASWVWILPLSCWVPGYGSGCSG